MVDKYWIITLHYNSKSSQTLQTPLPPPQILTTQILTVATEILMVPHGGTTRFCKCSRNFKRVTIIRILIFWVAIKALCALYWKKGSRHVLRKGLKKFRAPPGREKNPPSQRKNRSKKTKKENPFRKLATKKSKKKFRAEGARKKI